MRWGCRCWLASQAAYQEHGLPSQQQRGHCTEQCLLTLTLLQTCRGHVCACSHCCWSLHRSPLSPSPSQGNVVSAKLLVCCHPALTICDGALCIPSLSLAEGCSQLVLSRVRDGASRR